MEIGKTITLMALLLLIGVVGVSAVIEWVTPSASNTGVAGTQTLNVNTSTSDNIANLTFGYQLSTGGYVFIGEVINLSEAQEYFNTTWGTTGITDQAGVTLIAIAYGGATNSTEASAANLTAMDIDNTVPTTSYGIVPTNLTEGNTSIDFTTGTDASLTNCTLSFNSPINNTGMNFTAIASGSQCSMRFSNINDGTYRYRWYTLDNLNTSVSATGEVTIETTEGGLLPIQQAVAAGEVSDISKGALVAILLGVVVFVFKDNIFGKKK